MTAPDSRDSVERVVAEMHSTGNAIGPERMAPLLKEWADRLQALARGPQKAGGDDAKDAARWRALTNLDVGEYIGITSGNNPDELAAAIDDAIEQAAG